MMQMHLEIEKSFFPHFKAMIESLERDNKVSVIEVNDDDYTHAVPESLIVSSVEEVRRRVALAEERVANGQYLTEEEYEREMDTFFREELGVER